ncbi:hypothetical protein [Mariprofundus ferrinatatus]|uniref:hypothetical protein n=1 Tax=Mariprofundus ferrinatatus TaxID=1921087 RepID=UPI0012FF1D5F|nr:hypothetical protein [Mariprofundus ferrinatatus]
MPLLLMSGCGSEKTDILFECPSPDGGEIATIYLVSDGVQDVNRETKLNVRPASESFNSSMFSFSMRHGFDAIIRWQGDDQLELVYPQHAMLTHQEQVIFGTSQTFNPDARIRVSYSEQPSTHGYFVVEKRCFSGSFE